MDINTADTLWNHSLLYCDIVQHLYGQTDMIYSRTCTKKCEEVGEGKAEGRENRFTWR